MMLMDGCPYEWDLGAYSFAFIAWSWMTASEHSLWKDLAFS